MPFLHNFTFSNDKQQINALSDKEIISLLYHDIFDYPLTFNELIKWRGSKKIKNNPPITVSCKNDFYFLEGKEGIVLKRLLRRRISNKKLIIARKIGQMLRLIPTVKMVAVTGALAMENADENSDIDLLIVTKRKTLWLTRLITLFLFSLFRIPVRRYNDKNPKDKLCLNMWLDESNLAWKKKERNIYTAHEIAQIKPLLNKDKTYENLLSKNKWIKDYWPNAVRISKEIRSSKQNKSFLSVFESIAFQLQYQYMKSKITREKITKTRALFHPNDWGKIVLQRLKA
jgi:predicted nucleotidyltransferase